MSNDPFLVSAVGAVTTVTLNRPDVHNAFDDVFIVALREALERLDADHSVRAVVLAANGRSFSAGADLNWMKRTAQYTHAQNAADSLEMGRLFHVLDRLSKPTIAKVHGAAYGGGVGLVAACDIVVASERAKFCLSEVKLGLAPAVISPFVVRAIGARAARRYFLTAEVFTAARAQQLGLVHEVVPEDQLDAHINEILVALAAGGPAAQSASKTLISAVANKEIDEQILRSTADLIATLRASPEGQEGMQAFLGKRKANW